jgi:hypothetical protein
MLQYRRIFGPQTSDSEWKFEFAEKRQYSSPELRYVRCHILSRVQFRVLWFRDRAKEPFLWDDRELVR